MSELIDSTPITPWFWLSCQHAVTVLHNWNTWPESDPSSNALYSTINQCCHTNVPRPTIITLTCFNILHIQVCIGFLWLHIYVQRQLDHTTSENRSHWEVIEGQLEIFLQNPSLSSNSHPLFFFLWQIRFATIVLEFNAILLNGTNTSQDLSNTKVALPSEEEVTNSCNRGV
ncbi:hypothetical protein VP01_1057g1 [Puccinia sorghi]|uniref:Uncharacterized protein n=1 Tax=Puccinia sorghi TaxID=27349 RepID=A0A0L6VU91_9BASI|nr:hypothetical protein VP01_1057g1 [Puccinia sorghi]